MYHRSEAEERIKGLWKRDSCVYSDSESLSSYPYPSPPPSPSPSPSPSPPPSQSLPQSSCSHVYPSSPEPPANIRDLEAGDVVWIESVNRWFRGTIHVVLDPPRSSPGHEEGSVYEVYYQYKGRESKRTRTYRILVDSRIKGIHLDSLEFRRWLNAYHSDCIGSKL